MASNAPRPDAARIAVFAKAPVAGAVKTRLAEVLGRDAAASLHAGLVRHALSAAVQSRSGPVELWCAPDVSHPFFERCRDEFAVTLHRQQGSDLGERMSGAFAAAWAGGAALVIIGSDCPALDSAHIARAVEALAGRDAVFTPAEDGGYVLVGLSRPLPRLFEDIPWGGPAVMARTRERLAEARADWLELPTLWDVDRPEDYVRLQREGLLQEVLS